MPSRALARRRRTADQEAYFKQQYEEDRCCCLLLGYAFVIGVFTLAAVTYIIPTHTQYQNHFDMKPSKEVEEKIKRQVQVEEKMKQKAVTPHRYQKSFDRIRKEIEAQHARKVQAEGKTTSDEFFSTNATDYNGSSGSFTASPLETRYQTIPSTRHEGPALNGSSSDGSTLSSTPITSPEASSIPTAQTTVVTSTLPRSTRSSTEMISSISSSSKSTQYDSTPATLQTDTMATPTEGLADYTSTASPTPSLSSDADTTVPNKNGNITCAPEAGTARSMRPSGKVVHVSSNESVKATKGVPAEWISTKQFFLFVEKDCSMTIFFSNSTSKKYTSGRAILDVDGVLDVTGGCP